MPEAHNERGGEGAHGRKGRGAARFTGDVAAAIAVIRRRPHRHEQLAEEILVALHRQLVRSRDELELVRVEELIGDVRAEDVAGAARGDAPPLDVVVRVGPH